MQQKVIVEKQDLTYLKWSHARNSSGTAGTFLKSQSVVSGEKIYYKLSNFDSEKGIVGHECVNEIIVDRLLREFKVEANVGAPQVAYKETIRRKVDQETKYKRQSGGSGQYGCRWS